MPTAQNARARVIVTGAPLAAIAALLLAPALARAESWSSPTLLSPWLSVQGISCTSAGHCLAVGNLGSEGSVAIDEGGTWSTPTDPPGLPALKAVDCVSATTCIAVAFDGSTVTDTSGTWGSPEDIDGGRVLDSIACLSASECVAVDEHGHAVREVAGTWGSPEEIDGEVPLTSVSCTSGPFCVAVDQTGHTVTFSSGHWGVPAPLDAPNRLEAVSCTSGPFCVAVDEVGNEFTYSTGAWSAADRLSSEALTSVSCASASLCLAGSFDAAQVYTGTWKEETGHGAGLTSCVSGTTFCAETTSGGWTTTYSAGTWSAFTSFGGEFGSVSCVSSSFCVAADESGHALVYDGTAWGARVTLPGEDLGPHKVSCASTTFCMLLGGEHPILYNGSTWTEQTGANTEEVYWLSCPTEGFCMTAGFTGTHAVVQAYSGGTWGAPQELSDTHNLWSVSCASESFCVAVDEGGGALTYTGGHWSGPVAVDGTGWLMAVSCAPGTTFCVGVNFAMEAYVLKGGTWSGPTKIAPSSVWATISCASETFCMATTGSATGTSAIYNGTSWTSTNGLDPDGPYSVSCSSATFCAMVDELGFAYTYGYGSSEHKGGEEPNGGGTTSGGSGGGGGSTGGSGGGGGSSPPSSPGPSLPSPTAITAALSHVLVPSGRLAKLPAILKHDGFTLAFTAPSAGTVTIHWYEVPKGAHLASKAKPVLVATGQRTVSGAGAASVVVRLTSAGKHLLAHAKSLKLTTQATFTPLGGKATTTTRAFTLG